MPLPDVYVSSRIHIFVVRSLSALAITETELKLIAAAASTPLAFIAYATISPIQARPTLVRLAEF